MREPWVVSNELWGLVEPLIPKQRRRFRHPGRLPLEDRRVLFTVSRVQFDSATCAKGSDRRSGRCSRFPNTSAKPRRHVG
jgi:hypothetical protein